MRAVRAPSSSVPICSRGREFAAARAVLLHIEREWQRHTAAILEANAGNGTASDAELAAVAAMAKRLGG